MRSAPSITKILLTLALATSARAAAVLPASSDAGQLPNITIWDESNTQSPLWSKINASGSGPVFVLPVYTHCTMSCPVLAAKLLRDAAALTPGTAYRVLIFSFDPADDDASLRSFRLEHHLPAAWMLVRSTAPDIRRFTDYFQYNILTEGPVMIHTNQIFLLNDSLAWRATFIDEQWNTGDLQLWIKRAESPSLIAWFVMNPDKLAYIALGGLLTSLVLILWVLISHSRPSPQPTAAS